MNTIEIFLKLVKRDQTPFFSFKINEARIKKIGLIFNWNKFFIHFYLTTFCSGFFSV